MNDPENFMLLISKHELFKMCMFCKFCVIVSAVTTILKSFKICNDGV